MGAERSVHPTRYNARRAIWLTVDPRFWAFGVSRTRSPYYLAWPQASKCSSELNKLSNTLENEKAEARSVLSLLRTPAFDFQNCGRLLFRVIGCSVRPDDRPGFLFRCPLVPNRVQTENPSSNPASYCLSWFSPYMVCCPTGPVSGRAPSTFYSDIPVISPKETGKRLQRKPYTNSEIPNPRLLFLFL